jgi:hypothetical protein
MAASPNSARALKWEFFLTRWQQAYDLVASASASAAVPASAPKLSSREAAGLEMLIAKAERARAALAQLREFDARHRAMVARYGPMAESLPSLRRRLREEQQQQQQQQQQATPRPRPRRHSSPDPFGVRAGAPAASGPFGLLRSWSEHRAALARVSQAAAELTQRGGPPPEQLAAFNRERRALLAEAASLRRQLLQAGAASTATTRTAGAASRSGGQDDDDDGGDHLPLLPRPFDDPSATVARDCQQMEALALALRGVRAARAVALSRALARVELDELDARLALRLGRRRRAGGEDDHEQEAAAARAAVGRLRQVKQAWLLQQQQGQGQLGGGGGGGGGGGEGREAAAAPAAAAATTQAAKQEQDRRAADEAAEEQRERLLGWRATSFPQEVWEQLEADAEALAGVAARLRLREEARRPPPPPPPPQDGDPPRSAGAAFVTVTDASDLNVLRAQQALYDRLSSVRQQ